MGKLKILGGMLTVVMALSGAAAASAAELHSESTTTYFAGEQLSENVVTTAAGKIKCKKATFSGMTTAKTVASLALTPAYGECSAFGLAATRHVKCTFGLSFSTALTGAVTLCIYGFSEETTVPAGNCKVTIPPQTPTGPAVDYANLGSGTSRTVTMTSTVSGISYNVESTAEPPKKEGEATICGTIGKYSGAGGATWTGSIGLKGFSNEAKTTQTGIFVG